MANNKSIKNTRNSDSFLFKQLTKLFSGPLTNYNQQTQSRYKRTQLDKFQFQSAQGLEFKKAEYSSYENMSAKTMQAQNRADRYVDFDQMEYMAEIASALDIYADEMTTTNELTDMLKVKCPNEEIKSILETLYFKTLNLESNLFSWSRNMCKYGDYFLYLEIDDKLGVTSTVGLPSSQVERMEGKDKTNSNYIQFQWNSGGLTFENWQMAHFRILGNDKHSPYGTSVLDAARRTWRQLCVASGENVLTSDGYKPIEKIKKGDYVFCYDPDTNEIRETKVVAQKFMGKQSVFKLKTNHRSVKITANHGMLIKDSNGEFVYKQAKQITTNDLIPLVVNTGGMETIEIATDCEVYVTLKNRYEYESSGIMNRIRNLDCTYSDKNIHAFLNSQKRIPYSDWLKLKKEFDIPDEATTLWSVDSKKISLLNHNKNYIIDKKFARLFGFLLGDGWSSKNRVGFADGINEERNRFYRDILEDIACSHAHITPPMKGNRGGQTNIFSREFKEILDHCGFETGAFNKTVPAWIYSMSLEARREFIKGYFDADGGYSDGRATSISYKLLEGMRELSMMSGIPTNEIKQNRADGLCDDGSYRRASYRLYLNMNELQWNTQTTFEKVLEFDLVGEEDTYDIQVEDDVHNFIVEGMISHNTLLEDAMMAYRITRSPERKVFYIDVGNVPPEDIEQYMQKVMTQMKRNQILDSNTGRVDLRYNPTSVDEDYFIPVRGGVNNTKIEALPGGNFASAIEDVKYLRDKLFAALKVPMSYLIRGEGATEDKTTLAQKDIRFARTIQRLQRVIVAELEKIGIIHLYTLGFRGSDLISFKLSLNNPSKLAALQELEHWKVKFDVAGAATEGYFSKHWVAQNIFGLSDEQVVKIQREMFFDRKFANSLEQIGQPAETPVGGGGGGLDLGGGGEEGGEMPAETPEAGGEEAADDSMLLASPEGGGAEPAGAEAPAEIPPPGRREDGYYTTPGAKGKMYKQTQDSRVSGARKRAMRSQGGESMAGKSAIFPGIRGLSSAANGIYETQQSNYDIEEVELFKTNKEIKQLIENLEKNSNARKNES